MARGPQDQAGARAGPGGLIRVSEGVAPPWPKARGERQSFLLLPINEMVDEHYTVYMCTFITIGVIEVSID